MLAARPTISILMATYNQGEYLPQAIDSVLNQTSDDWELIVVDDGSDDNTREYLRTLTDPRIRTYRLSRNTGKAHCLNEALNRCSGSFLLELDADDWLDPTAIEQMIRITRNWPRDAGFVYGNVRMHRQGFSGAMPIRVLRGKSYQDKHQFLVDCDFFAPRLWRRDAVVAVGGWPTMGGKLREAHRLTIRVLARYSLAYVDYTVYNYRKHNKSLQARLGRQSWRTKKQDVITALKLWQSPYTPYFDDLMHLVFLRPETRPWQETSEPVTESDGRETVTEGTAPRAQWQREDDDISEPVPPQGEETQSDEPPEAPPSRRRSQPRPLRPVFGREVVFDDVPPKEKKPLPTVVETEPFPEDEPAEITPILPSPPEITEIEPSVAAAEPKPVEREREETTTIREPGPARPRPVPNMMGLETSSRGELSPEPSRSTVAFLPIATVGSDEEAITQTKYATLLARYLAQVFSGTALPAEVALRGTPSGSGFVATYLESVTSIQAKLQRAIRDLGPQVRYLVVIPGIASSRAAHLLNSAVTFLESPLSPIVINIFDILSGLQIPSDDLRQWAWYSIPYLEKKLGRREGHRSEDTDAKDESFDTYYDRITQRVRTHLRLATRRLDIRIPDQEREVNEPSMATLSAAATDSDAATEPTPEPDSTLPSTVLPPAELDAAGNQEPGRGDDGTDPES